jgi:RNA polymerase sigma factor (sigma-70 family)
VIVSDEREIKDNPLISESDGAWQELVDAMNPASLLVLIQSRMGPDLLRRSTPEDVLQDALMNAWRDRLKVEWRGVRAFRAWLLTVIDNRLRDLADYEHAQKRGGGRSPISIDAPARGGGSSSDGQRPQWLVATTTPSRMAVMREQAVAIRSALEALSPDVRDVVRLRVVEQRTLEQVADQLGMHISAVRRRLVKGAQDYQQLVMKHLAGRSGALTPAGELTAALESRQKSGAGATKPGAGAASGAGGRKKPV